MPENSLATLEPTVVCHLCRSACPPSFMAMQGRLNFCRMCANERSAECLVRLQGTRKAGRWVTVVVATIAFGFAAGGAFWSLRTLQLAAAAPLPHASAASFIEAAALKVHSSADAAEDASASSEGAAAWLQKILPDKRPRSVTDAGHIHLLFVTGPGTETCRGLSSRLFITREAPDKDSARLVTEVGEHMATSFDEGLRYVRKLPRGWEREFSVRLSFEDKFTSKDGGSAGTGFTVAMLAAIKEIAIDPDLAVTGDLTVDGTVQPVGAVVEKLRGAIAGGCKITLIPERNARDVTDLALLDGTSPLWETQVFSISTIDQALGLARQDRAENTAAALARFTALRARLPASVSANYLLSPIVQTELKEVLRLAPNHLSAATLLQASEARLPRELSLNRSVSEILSKARFFVSEVFNPKEKSPKTSENPGLTVFPEREFGQCVRELQQLTPMLDARAHELKAACLNYAGALRSVWTYQTGDLKGPRSSPQMQQVLQREQSFRQQAKDDLNDARSRLLMALRKLDTDGSLVSEMSKK